MLPDWFTKNAFTHGETLWVEHVVDTRAPATIDEMNHESKCYISNINLAQCRMIVYNRGFEQQQHKRKLFRMNFIFEIFELAFESDADGS